jgi:microcystin-dependent protein
MNANFTDIATGLTDCLTRDGQAPMTASLLLINGSSSVPSLAFAADPTNGIYRYGSGVLGVPGDLQVNGTVNQAGNPLVPVGSLMHFAGGLAPAGWLICGGQAVSRTTYAKLFAIIGTSYGIGDGSTTFNLPDLRGRVMAGFDDMGGVNAGRLSAVLASTSINGRGGTAQITLGTANLPPYTPTGSVSTPTFTGGTLFANSGTQAGSGALPIAPVLANSTSANTTVTITGTVSTPTFTGDAQGGTSSAVQTVQPTMVVSIIIKT